MDDACGERRDDGEVCRRQGMVMMRVKDEDGRGQKPYWGILIDEEKDIEFQTSEFVNDSSLSTQSQYCNLSTFKRFYSKDFIKKMIPINEL